MKKVEIKKQFLRMLEKVLVSQEFIKNKTQEWYEFIKERQNGFIGVIPIISQHGDIFHVSLAFQIRIDSVSEILCNLNDIRGEYRKGYPTLSFGISSLLKNDNNKILVDSTKSLESVMDLFENILSNEAKNIFNKIKTVKNLNDEINRMNRPVDLYCHEISARPFIGMICAVLTQNVQFDFWKDFYRTQLESANQYLKNQYDLMLSNLKVHTTKINS